MTRLQADYVIGGGGVAGLCLANRLIQNGVKVILVDGTPEAPQASPHAGGLLNPSAESYLHDPNLTHILQLAFSYFKNFLTHDMPALSEDFDHNTAGSWYFAIDEDGRQELMRDMAFKAQLGFLPQEYAPKEVLKQHPHLNHKICASYHMPYEGHLNPILWHQHLLSALMPSHSFCYVRGQVKEIHASDSKISHLQVVQQEETYEISASQDYIFATGVGTKQLNDQLQLTSLIRPVKGQYLILKTESPLLQESLRLYGRYPCYLAPRHDSIYVGATQQERHDSDIVAQSVMELLYSAQQILPELSEATLIKCGVSHRPATPDNKPIIGRWLYDNAVIINGLYRHGILLAPWCAQFTLDNVLSINQSQNPLVTCLAPERYLKKEWAS